MSMKRSTIHKFVLPAITILLLLVVLLPILPRHREVARAATAEANMRGILTTLTTYATQNNGYRLPSQEVFRELFKSNTQMLIDPRLPADSHFAAGPDQWHGDFQYLA